MFSAQTYIDRRNELKDMVGYGMIFIPGNGESAMNYPANEYHFRQDSTFLYYFGIDGSGYDAVIDIDNDRTIIFGNDRTLDDMVWMGPEPTTAEKADAVGVEETAPSRAHGTILKTALLSSQHVHFLPQYRWENKMKIEEYLGIKIGAVNTFASEILTRSVIAQRSIKSEEEIVEIEKAIEISYEMNTTAMRLVRPGIYEREVYGAIEGISLSKGSGVSFPIIFSVNGETLHNHYHGNLMREGQIAVLDSGSESLLHYASDITRTIPVSGKFTDVQKAVYNNVLRAQLASIEMIKPGVSFRECHLKAAEVLTDGLKEMGIMKGNTQDAVKNGAHALFMPHGLGHMMGLDVHDMEALNENLVGYDDRIKRSEQFGLSALRLGRELETGFVLTVEPGTYFIPRLINNWKKEKTNAEFINFDKLEDFMNFGGIRIEDDVLVTEDGYRVLGKPIPKTVEEVEQACSL